MKKLILFPTLLSLLAGHASAQLGRQDLFVGPYNAYITEANVLPAQAYADVGRVVAHAFADAGATTGNPSFVFTNLGISYIDPAFLSGWGLYAATAAGGTVSLTIDLSVNALSQSNVDDILNRLAGDTGHGELDGTTLDLSGGTNAAPTKASIGSVTITNGGTVYVTGEDLIFTGGGGTGAAGTIVATAGVITGITFTNRGSGYTSDPVVTVDTVAGTGAVLTAVRKNGDQIILEAASWIVNVN